VYVIIQQFHGLETNTRLSNEGFRR